MSCSARWRSCRGGSSSQAERSMRTRIGTDLIEIERIVRALERPGFRDRCFTPAEQAYCDAKRNPAESYAARFAGKEAVGKALGCGVYFTWKEIEIVGRPKPGVTCPGRRAATPSGSGCARSTCRSRTRARWLAPSRWRSCRDDACEPGVWRESLRPAAQRLLQGLSRSRICLCRFGICGAGMSRLVSSSSAVVVEAGRACGRFRGCRDPGSAFADSGSAGQVA